MKTNMKHTFITSILSLLLMTIPCSCTNLFDKSDNSNNEADANSCTISLAIASVEREISPALTTSDMTYSLYGKFGDEEQITFITDESYTDVTKTTINAKLGTWTFTLEGIKSGAVIMTSSVTKELTASSETLSFALIPSTEGTGTAAITVQMSTEAAVSNTTITLTKAGETEAAATQTIATTDSTIVTTANGVSSFTYTNANLAPGSYLLLLTLTYGASSATYSYPEAVVIYRNCTSAKTYGFTSKTFTEAANVFCTQDTFASVLAKIDDTSSKQIYTIIVTGTVTDFSVFSTALASYSCCNTYLDFTASITSSGITSPVTDTFTSCTKLWGLSLPSGTTGVTTYTLTFNTEGGSAIAAEAGILSGRHAIQPEAPEKDGYTFYLWNTDETYKYDYDFENNTITENKTLYAHWMKDITITHSCSTAGVSFTISGIPEDAQNRFIYEGIKGQIAFSSDKSTTQATTYFYPFVSSGSTYTFTFRYSDASSNYNAEGSITFEATGGSGEVAITNKDNVAYTINNHIFHWTTAPTITGNQTGIVKYMLFTPKWGWVVGRDTTSLATSFSDFNIKTGMSSQIYIPYKVFLDIVYCVTIEGVDYSFDITCSDPFYINNLSGESRIDFVSADNGVLLKVLKGTDLANYDIDELYLELKAASGNLNYTVDLARYISDGNTVDSDGYYDILLPYINPNEAYHVNMYDKNRSLIYSVDNLAISYGNSCSTLTCTNASSLNFAINSTELTMTSTTAPAMSNTTPLWNMKYALYTGSTANSCTKLYDYNSKSYSDYNGTLNLVTDLVDSAKYKYDIKTKLSGKYAYVSLDETTAIADYLDLDISLGQTETVLIGPLTSTITFYAGGGAYADASTSKTVTGIALGATYGTAISSLAENPTLAQKIFNGWAYDKSGTTTDITTTDAINSDITLTAKWIDRPDTTVSILSVPTETGKALEITYSGNCTDGYTFTVTEGFKTYYIQVVYNNHQYGSMTNTFTISNALLIDFFKYNSSLFKYMYITVTVTDTDGAIYSGQTTITLAD